MSTKTKTDRETILSECAIEVREGIAEQTRGAIRAGRAFNVAAEQFNANEKEQFQTWCKNTSGKSWETCRQYMAVAAMTDGLTKTRAAKVEGQTFEVLQALVATPDEYRAEVISEIGKGKQLGTKPSPEMVREYRDEIVPVDPADVAAKEERQRKNAADKTLALVQELSGKFAGMLRSEDRNAVILTALKLAQDRKGQDVAAAFKQYVAQREAAQKAADKKAAKEAEAGKALLALEASAK